MGKDTMQLIDPTNLNNEQSLLLNALLEQGVANNTFVWDSAVKYKIPHMHIELTHRIVHRSRINPVTKLHEDRHEVLTASNQAAEGTHSRVVDVVGTLTPSRAGLFSFKTSKPRTVKIQSFKDPGKITVNNKSQGKEQILNEAAISVYADHLHAKKITLDPNSYQSFLVLKKFSGKSLDHLIGNERKNIDAIRRRKINLGATLAPGEMNVEDRLQLSLNLLQAMQEQIHDKRIIHRDIKPENIIVDADKKWLVNIIDLGFSRKIENLDNEQCGTAGFAAPEIFLGQHTFKSDVYSMGVVLGLLWGGELDKDKNLVALFSAISATVPEGEKSKIQALIASMLDKSPETRVTTAEAIEVFNQLLLARRLKPIPVEHHQDVVSANRQARDTRIILRHNVKSFEGMVGALKDAIAVLPNNEYAVAEFKHNLKIDSFSGLNSSNSMFDCINAFAKEYRLFLVSLNDLRHQVLTTLHSLNAYVASTDSENRNLQIKQNLIDQVSVLDEEIRTIQYKLGKHQANFDKSSLLLDRFRQNYLQINERLEKARSEFSTLRDDKAELLGRLHGNYDQSALGKLKRVIVENVRAYYGGINLWNPRSLFSNPISPRRIRDVHEILDIVDFADTPEILYRYISTRLLSLEKGFTGRSQLQENIEKSFSESFDLSSGTRIKVKA